MFARAAGGRLVYEGAGPTKANTDADAVNNYEETVYSTNPLLKGFTVALTVDRINLSNDGDDPSGANTVELGAGDIRLRAIALKPSATAANGPGSDQTFYDAGGGFDGVTGAALPLASGATLRFATLNGIARATTLEVAPAQSFSFGAVLDGPDGSSYNTPSIRQTLVGHNGVRVSLDGQARDAVLTGFDLGALFTNDIQRSVTKELKFAFVANETETVGTAFANDKRAGDFYMTLPVDR